MDTYAVYRSAVPVDRHSDCTSPASSSSADALDPAQLNGLFSACAYHRRILIGLSSALQIIVLHAPVSVMWMPSSPGTPYSMVTDGSPPVAKKDGSPKGYCPLDLLHIFPSELPLAKGSAEDEPQVSYVCFLSIPSFRPLVI